MGLFRNWLEANYLGDAGIELVKNKENRDPYSVLKELYNKNKNLVVTFTSVNKVGINPQSTFDTPLGIYFYPLYYVLKMKMEVPFVKEAPYIQVCEVNKNVKNMEPMSGKTGEWMDDQEGLEELLSLDSPKVSIGRILREISQYYEIRSNYSALWLGTKLIANNKPVQWNKLLRSLGYDGFIDHGTGTIHTNEPTQGVVFSADAVKVVMTVPNNRTRAQRRTLYRGEWADINREKVLEFSKLLYSMHPPLIDKDKNFDIDRAKQLYNTTKKVLMFDDKNWMVRQALVYRMKSFAGEFGISYGHENIEEHMHPAFAAIYKIIMRLLINKSDGWLPDGYDDFASHRGSIESYEKMGLNKIEEIIKNAWHDKQAQDSYDAYEKEK